MTESTPQGREKGAGERGRELAEQLDVLYLYDIEHSTWLIPEALATSAVEARLEATQVAKELAQILTLEQLQGVSRPTAYWIAKHFGLKVVKNEPSGELD